MGLKTLWISFRLNSPSALIRSGAQRLLFKKMRAGTVSPQELDRLDRDTVCQLLASLMNEGVFNNLVLSRVRWEEIVAHPKTPLELKLAVFRERGERNPSIWREDTFEIIASSPHVPTEISRKVFEERARKMTVLEEKDYDNFVNHPAVPQDIIEIAARTRAHIYPEQVLKHPKTPAKIIAEIINEAAEKIEEVDNGSNSKIIFKVVECLKYRPQSEWKHILIHVDSGITNLIELLGERTP